MKKVSISLDTSDIQYSPTIGLNFGIKESNGLQIHPPPKSIHHRIGSIPYSTNFGGILLLDVRYETYYIQYALSLYNLPVSAFIRSTPAYTEEFPKPTPSAIGFLLILAFSFIAWMILRSTCSLLLPAFLVSFSGRLFWSVFLVGLFSPHYSVQLLQSVEAGGTAADKKRAAPAALLMLYKLYFHSVGVLHKEKLRVGIRLKRTAVNGYALFANQRDTFLR
jgi:hypothetical protein